MRRRTPAKVGINRRDLLIAAASVAGAANLLPPVAAVAQNAGYPNRSIRVIVPFAAGGPSDIIARIVADALYPHLGQALVIENRAGGGANIGLGAAARAQPDGYTLLITTSAIAINPSLYKNVPYDPFKDFAPISDLATSPQTLSVKPGYAKTLAEFIAKAKAAPGALNYSSPGVGTQAQLTAELLKRRAGIDIVHVPFAGGPPATQAVLTGTTQLVVNALPTAESLLRAGTLQGLAVTGETRWPSLPDLPTLIECGFPGFVSDTFAGLFAPAGTPKEIVSRLAAAVAEVLKEPQVAERARQAGFLVVGGGPAALAKRVADEYALNRDIIEKAGIEMR
jgi:tripartite-type tricarboxylate transporter receptor subunit TctC